MALDVARVLLVSSVGVLLNPRSCGVVFSPQNLNIAGCFRGAAARRFEASPPTLPGLVGAGIPRPAPEPA